MPGLVVSLALSLPGTAGASPLSPPEAVRGLVLAGDLAGARDLLLAWQPRSATDVERRLWLLAVIHRESGRPELALEVLQELVSRRPDVARFRLELAETLSALGQRDRAAYQYEQALGGDLSAEQRSRAEDETARLARPTPWSGSFGIALVPSSNPGRKTQEETLDLGFGQAVLSAESRARPATGMTVQARAAYAHAFSDRLQGQLGLRFEGTYYDDSADSDRTGVVEARLIAAPRRDMILSTTLSYQHRSLGGAAYSEGPGLGLHLLTRAGPRGRIGAGLSLTDLSHARAPGADGLRSVVSLSYDHAASSSLTLRASLRHERVAARSAEVAATTWEAGLGASYAFRGGLILDGDLWLRRSGRDGPHRLFGIVQQDRRQTLSLRLRHSEISWAGFAPYLELTGERQTSNIPVYGYTARDLTLGLTRRF
ncbi:MAG: DUF560 domain-containing protein [Rhodobacteraceae bacterium]|nr:DUF560 domain-containing protein [Paracoccaceae bacterium]MBR9822897.1 DUF560 domain-containing protein [Paracoccaceae bacterium]